MEIPVFFGDKKAVRETKMKWLYKVGLPNPKFRKADIYLFLGDKEYIVYESLEKLKIRIKHALKNNEHFNLWYGRFGESLYWKGEQYGNIV